MADDKAAEATAETVENKIAEVIKVETEVKEEQTPETPVTEPLTNGSSTPESPKVETLASDEAAAPAPVAEQPQATPVPETTPEQLPVNGLSLEEPKKETAVVAPIEGSKPEDSTPVAKETVPVPEIPVKTEETVSEDEVAPPQTEIKTVNPGPEPVPNIEKVVNESADETSKTEINILKEPEHIATTEMVVQSEVIDETKYAAVSDCIEEVNAAITTANTDSILPSVESQNRVVEDGVIENKDSIDLCSEKSNVTLEPTSDIPDTIDELPPPPPVEDIDIIQREEKVIAYPSETIENTININHNVVNDTETNGIIDETELNQIKNIKKDALGNIIDTVECNGNAMPEESVLEELTTATNAEEMVNGKSATTPEDSLPPSLSEAPAAGSDASDSLPPPPADLADPDDDSLRLQDPLPITDKIADLMPEIPTVPELKTETETSSEVAVAD